MNSLGRIVVGSRPVRILSGKADVDWEEPGRITRRPTGIEDQASRKGLAEITSGRAITQQGLAATCKDPPSDAVAEGGGRVLVWRMSP